MLHSFIYKILYSIIYKYPLFNIFKICSWFPSIFQPANCHCCCCFEYQNEHVDLNVEVCFRPLLFLFILMLRWSHLCKWQPWRYNIKAAFRLCSYKVTCCCVDVTQACLTQKGLSGASLVAQWLRICLPMQGTRVRALVWEDPTYRGATGPVSHNY